MATVSFEDFHKVQNILKDAGTGRAYRIITTPDHGISTMTSNVTVKIIDRS